MVVPVVITATVTFVLVSLWQLWATKKNRRSQQVMISLLLDEMESMAKGQGYNDLFDYWLKTKGEQGAKTAILNINNLLHSFSDKGVD